MAEPWEIYQTMSQSSPPASPSPTTQQQSPEPWEIYSSAPQAPEDTIGNRVRGVVSHGLRAISDIPGWAGDVQRQIENTVMDSPLADYVDPKWKANPDATHLPDSQDVENFYHKYLPLNPTFDPDNQLGTSVIGDYAGAALAPGGPVVRLGRVGTSAAAGETAKGIVRGVGGDNVAQSWAQLIGGGLGAAAGLGGARGVDMAIADSPPVRAATNAAKSVVKTVAPYLDPGNYSMDPNRLGTVGGNVDFTLPPGNPPPNTPPSTRSLVGQRAVALAKRDGLTPENFDQRYAAFQNAGVNPTVGEFIGPSGDLETKALVSSPGKAAGMSQALIPQLRSQIQPAAVKAVDAATSSAPTRLTASQALDQAEQGINERYAPILHDQAVTPELAQRSVDILDRLKPSDLAKIDAEGENLARAEGIPEMNSAQTLQYMKRALWQYAQKLQAQPETAQRGAAYKGVFYDLQQALHDPDTGIPGYAAVDNDFSAIQNARAAMKWGGDMLSDGKTAPRPDEVAAQFSQLSPMSQEHVRIGVRDELARQLGSKPVDRTTLNNFVENDALQQKLRTVLGPQEAQGMIDKLNTLRQHSASLQYMLPKSGSPTMPLFSQFTDMMGDAGVGAQLPHLGVEQLPAWAISNTFRFAKDPGAWAQRVPLLGQQFRNLHAAQMLQEMTPEVADQFKSKLADALLAQRSRGMAAALAARPTGQQQGNHPP